MGRHTPMTTCSNNTNNIKNYEWDYFMRQNNNNNNNRERERDGRKK